MVGEEENSNSYTLDPPGKIAVIGAGPLGIEAALYGRYLGYDVTIYEAHEAGFNLTSCSTEDLPLLPDRTLSNLAVQALLTQQELASLTFPVSINQWVCDHLKPLTETDLLAGRVFTGCNVKRIDLVPVEPEQNVSHSEVIPADFRITYTNTNNEISDEIFEATILAVGKELNIELQLPPNTPYLFRIGAVPSDDWENSLVAGYREITRIFADLGGRPDLDLYRPKRH